MEIPAHIPGAPGVYLMKDRAGRVLYVGKAKNLKKRISSYFSGRAGNVKIDVLVSRIAQIDYIAAASSREALILEDRLVKKLRPFYNTLLRDDKSFPWLKISLSDDFPSVTVHRRKNPREGEKKGDRIFGPYPETPGLRKLAFRVNRAFGLKLCRKIPPSEILRKNCVYLQTGKCAAPCVGIVAGKDSYLKSAEKAARFLAGGLANFKKTLLDEIKKLSAELKYEKAAEVRDILRTIEGMTAGVRFREVTPDIYEKVSSVTENLENLRRTLGLDKVPLKIDCVDVSNTGGAHAVGAAVRFNLGEPDKKLYRRYKIKTPELGGTQNDFAMIKEIVGRRLRRLAAEEPGELPDLFVVDGGKGQLSAAAEAVKHSGARTQLASIAKGSGRDEIIVWPSGETVEARDGDASLAIIRRIRDEAHRFAVAYHRKLRDAGSSDG